MNPQSTSFLMAILVPFLYAGALWCRSRLSGWHALSRRYPDRAPAASPLGRIWCGSLRLGLLGHYRGSVVCTVHPTGLRLASWIHLRIGHAPIFLPWSELRCIPRARLRLLEGLEVRTRHGNRMWLPRSLALELRRLSEGRFWPVTPPPPDAGVPAPGQPQEMPAALPRA